MKRRPDWEQRLHDYISKVHDRPHAYGSHDCLLHPANAIKAITGRDLGRGHRGQYKSAASASRYLRSLGFATPEAMLDSLLPEVPVGFAQRGDIVLCDDGIPAVCFGEFALAVGESSERVGLHRVPPAQWVKAWRVG